MLVVTGGAGFIGSAVVRYLHQKGLQDEVLAADNFSKGADGAARLPEGTRTATVDLTDARATESVLRGASICFHLAAKVGGIGYFHKFPATILDQNLVMLSNVLKAAIVNGTKVVYVSSSMVFERTNVFPTPETAIESCPPPLSAYGFSKLAGEYMCRAFHEEHGLTFVIVRPFNAYGPGELPDNEVGIAHVIPDLARKILGGDNPLEILGDGEQVRSYTFVEDVAEAIYLCATDPRAECEDFNIGYPQPISVKELARKLWHLAGRTGDLRFKHVPTYKHDVRRRFPDIEKIRRVLGWSPKVDLDQGLAVTLKWLESRL